MSVTTEIKDNEKLEQGLRNDVYQMIVLPYRIEELNVFCRKFEEEHLLFLLPSNHRLSKSKELSFKDLDGETMLLFSQIGFWHKIRQEKMPNTKFLIQEERFAFDELVKASDLPSFTSDIAIQREDLPGNRVAVKIIDNEAHAEFYFACKAGNKQKLAPLLQRIKTENLGVKAK